MQTSCDALIIGGGPAGCSAATFISRCRWSAFVMDRSASSGHLGSLGTVSYFPGFPESISGAELLKRMRRQAELVGAHFLSDGAIAISGEAPAFKVSTEGGKEYQARSIVIATGAAARTNYLHGEREFLGKGVSYDVLADGPAVAKRSTAVIGKNRHAAEEALALARFAEKVHFIIPSSKLDVDDSVLKELQNQRAIEMHFSVSLKKINGQDHVNSITVFTGGQEKEIPVVGVFTYVHDYMATTSFLDKAVELTQAGAVKVDRSFATSTEGIFACGDVLCAKPQLPAISASQGMLAGLSVDKHLSSLRHQ
ncbi:MAG: FAD-dependent oxidoreductase [bacterium]